MSAPQTLYDDLVGAFIELIEAFPPGFEGSHLATHFYLVHVPAALEHVSAERLAEWDSLPPPRVHHGRAGGHDDDAE